MKPQLHPGQMMPDFELQPASGSPVRVSDYRNRYNLVLIFYTPDTKPAVGEYLAQLAELEDDFRYENTRTVVVVPAEMTGDVGENVYTDPINQAYKTVSAADYLPNPGGVAVVVDRFGEINAIFRLDTGEELPPGDVLLEEVRFIELQCPE